MDFVLRSVRRSSTDSTNENNKMLNKYKMINPTTTKANQPAVDSQFMIKCPYVDYLILDRVLYARKGGEEGALSTTNLGGEKITVEDACVSSC